MIFCQDVDVMSHEQLAALIQGQLVGRRVSIPLRDSREPVPGMYPWPYPPDGIVTALRDDLVYGLYVLIESPGFPACGFQVSWALENLTVIG